MAIRRILIYPQDRLALRAHSEPVERVDRSVRRLIDDLLDTLAAEPAGIGLAAPQINVHLQVVVVRLGSNPQADRPAVSAEALVNPDVLEAGDERLDDDGCLSFPGWFGRTVRPHFLKVQGLKADGLPFRHTFTGFDAVIVHHEIDHLNGVLFIDHIRRPEDLFRFTRDSRGRTVKVPLSTIPVQTGEQHHRLSD